jgi:hypothetical protein
VNEKMSATVSEYLQTALTVGAEIPAAMKPILQSMIDQGVLVDANGEAITDLEATGIQFSETMTAGFDRVVTKLQELIDHLNGTGQAIQNIPKTIDIGVNYDQGEFEPWSGMPSVPAFANEGMVSRPTLALIGDAPEPEMVLRESTVARVAATGLERRAGQTGTDAAMAAFVAVVQDLPRTIARKVTRGVVDGITNGPRFRTT